ncbi:hypothetical protein GQ53DRAFT_838371 [Thozetella sp. PMI_491]|nr:hypothetical protein GQ53DRAFT_838371 [Thozetella sp. PMI_491]
MSCTHFDPFVCAALHNEIVAILATQAAEHNNRLVRNFFLAYEGAENLRPRLSPELITFLEAIDLLVSDGEDGLALNFAPHLAMPHPNEFWILNGGLPNLHGETHEDWVILYRATEPEYGVYFDMETGLCTWQQEATPWLHTWFPLERALRLLLSFYRSGRFQATVGDEQIYEPTGHRRYTPADLNRDLDSYHNLLAAIQARCLDSTVSEEPGLIDEGVLDEFRISGFLRDFLLKARRPSFAFIAPGLQLPCSSLFQETVQRDKGSERYNLVREEGRVPQDDEPWDPGWMQKSSNRDGEPMPLFFGPPIELGGSQWIFLSPSVALLDLYK